MILNILAPKNRSKWGTTSLSTPSDDKSISNENEAANPEASGAKELGGEIAKEIGGLETGQMKIVEVATGRSFLFSGAIHVYRKNDHGELKEYTSSSTDIFHDYEESVKGHWTYIHYRQCIVPTSKT